MTENTDIKNSGVSRVQAESILKRFLEDENYRVLVVKGNWGIGKTYLIQNFLYESKKDYYVYASVFGVSSIEQLKARLLANYKSDFQINNISKIKKLLDSVNKKLFSFFEFMGRNDEKIARTPKMDLVLPGGHPISLVGSLISVTGDLALNILFNENVKNSIICIDDLERTTKLSLDELLGFVEYIVQQLKCKVILVYNENKLDEGSIKILDQYREKVIDREFKLHPTVEENLNLIFNNHPDIEVIKEVFLRAGTNNIRVIYKTKWLIDELIPLMENWQNSLRNQVISNSVVINLVKLDHEFSKRFPITIDTILSSIDSSKYQDKNNDTSEKRRQAISLLSYLGYDTLGLDNQIIQLIETSFFSPEDFIKQGELLNKREQNNPVIKKLHEFGKPYYTSFADCEQEIANEITDFLEDHHLDLSFSEFEKVEEFAAIIKVDISRYEKSLLEYMLKNSELGYIGRLNPLRAKINKYPDLEAYFTNKKNEYYQTLDITTSIKNIIKSDYSSRIPWFEANIEFLNNCTVDEYSQWLEKGHPDLAQMVRLVLKERFPASQKLEQAIRILAQKNELNKTRAKFIYGIDIANPSDTQ